MVLPQKPAQPLRHYPRRRLVEPPNAPVDAARFDTRDLGRAHDGRSGKPRALEIVDHADARARRIGAISCVTVQPDGSLTGTNNDWYGFLENLREAFSGWRDSPPHRANLLTPGVTRLGIAAVYAPGSKYKVFWALVMTD